MQLVEYIEINSSVNEILFYDIKLTRPWPLDWPYYDTTYYHNSNVKIPHHY